MNGVAAAREHPREAPLTRLGRGLTLAQLWLFLAVALPVVATFLASLSMTDLAYHLRLGGQILDGHGIPNSDTFTFTVFGAGWQDQQWGAQVILAATYRLGGWGALVILRALVVGVTFGAVLVGARRAGARERDAALLTVGAFLVAAVALALRPQLFGMLLFALTLLVIRERHEHPRLLWAIPLLTIVWANVHGSFFLAPVALGFAWLADLEGGDGAAARRTFIVAVAAAVAALVNPLGPWVYAYAVGLSTDPIIAARVTEWQPTSLRSVPGIAFYGSGLIVAAVLARRARPTRWSTLAWLGALFLLGAYAIRGVAWWPLGAAVSVAAVLGTAGPAPVRPRPAGDQRLRLVNLAIAGVIVLAGVALLPFWRPSDSLTGPAGVIGNAPAGITRAIQASAAPGDRIFAPQPWGSWFEFATPEQPVFIDSRIELFPRSVFDDYDAIVDGQPGWQAVLDRWDVAIVVVAKGQPDAFHDRMRSEPGWREIYADEDGWVFARAATSSRSDTAPAAGAG